MDLTEREDNFNRKRGEILRIALNIESFFDFTITTYFMGSPIGQTPFENESGKRAFFQEGIAYNLKFELKRQIFEQICKRKDLSKEKIKEIMDKINFIHDLRNKVAHDDMRRTDSEGPYLVKRDSLTPYKYKLYLTDELMEKTKKMHREIIDEIFKLTDRPF